MINVQYAHMEHSSRHAFVVHCSYPLLILLESLKVLKAWETEVIARCTIVSTTLPVSRQIDAFLLTLMNSRLKRLFPFLH